MKPQYCTPDSPVSVKLCIEICTRMKLGVPNSQPAPDNSPQKTMENYPDGAEFANYPGNAAAAHLAIFPSFQTGAQTSPR